MEREGQGLSSTHPDETLEWNSGCSEDALAELYIQLQGGRGTIFSENVS